MKKHKKLYDKAQLPEDWSAYWLTRNTVNVLLDTAHRNYCDNLFTESFQNNKKQFWLYIKRIRKDHSGVSPLILNGETNSRAKDKARVLNNQFESVFSNEDLSNISIMTSDATPQMPSISFSAHGILENLVLGKAPGPDVLTTFFQTLCLQNWFHSSDDFYSLLILSHF